MDPFCHSHFKLRSSTRLSMYRYSYRMQVEAPALLSFFVAYRAAESVPPPHGPCTGVTRTNQEVYQGSEFFGQCSLLKIYDYMTHYYYHHYCYIHILPYGIIPTYIYIYFYILSHTHTQYIYIYVDR